MKQPNTWAFQRVISINLQCWAKSHFKPMGKMCYFNRLELEQWLQSNRVSTNNEISQKAQAYCMQKGGAL